jgi:hypothetical protein
MEDAALSAFGVFFTQTPSFLAYQRKMADSKGKSNAQSLFGFHIPKVDPQTGFGIVPYLSPSFADQAFGNQTHRSGYFLPLFGSNGPLV